MRALALVMLLSTPVWAAEVHVEPGTGTLAAAIAGATPGDVLVLSGGAYLGPVTIDRTLTLHGDGQATIEEIGWEMFRLMLDVASGRKKTWAEQWKLHNALVLFNPAPVT